MSHRNFNNHRQILARYNPEMPPPGYQVVQNAQPRVVYVERSGTARRHPNNGPYHRHGNRNHNQNAGRNRANNNAVAPRAPNNGGAVAAPPAQNNEGGQNAAPGNDKKML